MGPGDPSTPHLPFVHVTLNTGLAQPVEVILAAEAGIVTEEDCELGGRLLFEEAMELLCSGLSRDLSRLLMQIPKPS